MSDSAERVRQPAPAPAPALDAPVADVATAAGPVTQPLGLDAAAAAVSATAFSAPSGASRVQRSAVLPSRPVPTDAAPPIRRVQRSAVIQREGNDTGMPDHLKAGIERLSGYSMDDVQVHYNSPKPAQIQAHAYAQGNEIHVASGQEQHLGHEAWHVVQQRQGRVSATMSPAGIPINDDPALEAEADQMGSKALEVGAQESASGN